MTTANAEADASGLLPMAVFLDTNILDSLPENLESGELSGLVGKAGRVFVPDIVAREWIAHRFDKALKSISNSLKAKRHLNQYSGEWIKTNLEDTKTIYCVILHISVKRLRGAGLTVLAPPRINVRDLTTQATLEVPPFRSQGRGFKDELVLLSILKLLSRKAYKSALLVTDDSDFGTGVVQRFKNQGVNLLITRSLAKANKLLDQSFTAAARGAWERRNAAVVELAKQYWEQIRKSLEDSATAEGLPEATVRSWSAKDLPENCAITKLVEVVPLEISGAMAGPRHMATGRTLVTLFVDCDVQVEIKMTDWGGLFLRSAITFEGKNPSTASPRTESKVVALRRSIAVQATAKEDEDGKWSDLAIEDKGEYFRLLNEIRGNNE